MKRIHERSIIMEDEINIKARELLIDFYIVGLWCASI